MSDDTPAALGALHAVTLTASVAPRIAGSLVPVPQRTPTIFAPPMHQSMRHVTRPTEPVSPCSFGQSLRLHFRIDLFHLAVQLLDVFIRHLGK